MRLSEEIRARERAWAAACADLEAREAARFAAVRARAGRAAEDAARRDFAARCLAFGRLVEQEWRPASAVTASPNPRYL